MVLAAAEIAPTEKRTRQRNLKIGEREEPIRMGTFGPKLHRQFARRPFEARLREVIGVDWVDEPFGWGDLAVSCNRCVVFSELFINTAKAESRAHP